MVEGTTIHDLIMARFLHCYFDFWFLSTERQRLWVQQLCPWWFGLDLPQGAQHQRHWKVHWWRPSGARNAWGGGGTDESAAGKSITMRSVWVATSGRFWMRLKSSNHLFLLTQNRRPKTKTEQALNFLWNKNTQAQDETSSPYRRSSQPPTPLSWTYIYIHKKLV